MSEPYRPPRRRSERNKAVVIGSLVLVAISSVLTWLVVDYAAENPGEVNLPGGDRFVVGEAERFAERIREQRTPLFFKDPLTAGPGREIWVLHDGDQVDAGWYAVRAYAPDDPHELRCALEWVTVDRVFRSPCSGRTYQRDDDALTRYPAEVNADGKVEVNLRR
ncbi:MAG TPA: hypothetical protein VF230_06990 [Acidimicrobiales bacterium]